MLYGGIKKKIDSNIITYREENGGFKNRKQLKEVPLPQSTFQM